MSGNHGGYDGWVVALDNAGELQWQHCVGDASHNFEEFALVATEDGAAVSWYTAVGDPDTIGLIHYFDAYVHKFDSTGAEQWVRNLSAYDVAVSDLLQTPDGGLVVIGRGKNYGDHTCSTNGGLDYWLVKLGAYTGLAFVSESASFAVYPNPATGVIQVENKSSTRASL